MLEKLPIKKEYLLAATALVLLWVCYQFAFKKTIEAWQTKTQLSRTLEQTSNVSEEPDYFKRKTENLNKVLSLYSADTTNLRSSILNTIAVIAEKNNAKLVSVPIQDDALNSEHYFIEKLAFEGDYRSLLELSDQLESLRGVGRIRSEYWNVKESTNLNKTLFLTIFLEIKKE